MWYWQQKCKIEKWQLRQRRLKRTIIQINLALTQAPCSLKDNQITVNDSTSIQELLQEVGKNTKEVAHMVAELKEKIKTKQAGVVVDYGSMVDLDSKAKQDGVDFSQSTCQDNHDDRLSTIQEKKAESKILLDYYNEEKYLFASEHQKINLIKSNTTLKIKLEHANEKLAQKQNELNKMKAEIKLQRQKLMSRMEEQDSRIKNIQDQSFIMKSKPGCLQTNSSCQNILDKLDASIDFSQDGHIEESNLTMMDPPSLLNKFSTNYMALEKKNKELNEKLQEIQLQLAKEVGASIIFVNAE